MRAILFLLLVAVCSARARLVPALQASTEARVGQALMLSSRGAGAVPLSPSDPQLLQELASRRSMRATSPAMLRLAMLRLVNAARARRRLPPVCLNSKLNAAAQAHAVDQARMRRMSHTGSNGSSMSSRIDAAGYNWMALGENVAWGYTTVRSVFIAW